MLGAMLLLALMLPAPACETPTRTSDVLEATGRAEIAYTALDASAFDAALAEAREDLGCLGEPLTADGAAAYHRAEALGAFGPPRNRGGAFCREGRGIREPRRGLPIRRWRSRALTKEG